MTKFNKEKVAINVIRDFDGSTGELVNTIYRIPQVALFGEPGHKYTKNGRYSVSYKGKRYITFILPECYGELSGLCIKVKTLSI